MTLASSQHNNRCNQATSTDVLRIAELPVGLDKERKLAKLSWKSIYDGRLLQVSSQMATEQGESKLTIFALVVIKMLVLICSILW